VILSWLKLGKAFPSYLAKHVCRFEAAPILNLTNIV
jgi:hypothetical protein